MLVTTMKLYLAKYRNPGTKHSGNLGHWKRINLRIIRIEGGGRRIPSEDTENIFNKATEENPLTYPGCQLRSILNTKRTGPEGPLSTQLSKQLNIQK